MALRKTRLSTEDKQRLDEMVKRRGIDTGLRDDTEQHKLVAEERARKKAEALKQKKLAA